MLGTILARKIIYPAIFDISDSVTSLPFIIQVVTINWLCNRTLRDNNCFVALVNSIRSVWSLENTWIRLILNFNAIKQLEFNINDLLTILKQILLQIISIVSTLTQGHFKFCDTSRKCYWLSLTHLVSKSILSLTHLMPTSMVSDSTHLNEHRLWLTSSQRAYCPLFCLEKPVVNINPFFTKITWDGQQPSWPAPSYHQNINVMPSLFSDFILAICKNK